jgi:hypothetical protein
MASLLYKNHRMVISTVPHSSQTDRAGRLSSRGLRMIGRSCVLLRIGFCSLTVRKRQKCARLKLQDLGG